MSTRMNFGIDGVAHIDGGLRFDGYFGSQTKTYPNPPYYNAELWAEACIDVVDVCARIEGILSSKGIAGCLSIDLWLAEWEPGFGYEWGGAFTPYFTGCDVSDYRDHFATRTRRKGQVIRRPKLTPGQEGTVDLGPGMPGAVIVVTGESAPPQVTLVGPNGERITTPRVLGGMMQKPFMVMKDAKGNRTSIAIGQPAGGTWRVIVEEGSSPVTRIESADGLAKPQVKGTVTGKGLTRTLNYEIAPREGQVVKFYEEGPSAGAYISSASDAKGTLTWVPGEGAAETRTVYAVVEQDGMGRGRFEIAKYAASKTPKPGKPTKLAVKRKGSSLNVSWRKVTGAGSYSVLAVLSDGRRIVLSTKKSSVRVKDARRVKSAVVSVSASSPGGVEGASSRVKFPAKKRKRR